MIQKSESCDQQTGVLRKYSSQYNETNLLEFKNCLEEFIKQVKESLQTNNDIPISCLFVQSLVQFIMQTKETTRQGMTQDLKKYASFLIEQLNGNEREILQGKTVLIFQSTFAIFFEYLNNKWPTISEKSVDNLKLNLQKMGKEFALSIQNSYEIISMAFKRVIKRDCTVLVTGLSTLVKYVLLQASTKIHFSVIIPETRPFCEGSVMAEKLIKANIPTQLIADTAVGYALEQVDFVLSGSEAVVENGGIINRVGTLTIALCAKAMKKPFYVAAESVKFTRQFPLSQKDLQPEVLNLQPFALNKDQKVDEKIQILTPSCDYTPPEYITLLITDKGVFTPSAVSDELIELFINS